MDNLQKLKEVYLSDVSSELYEENLAQITEWETKLIESENMISWQGHETTIQIKKQAKETYVDLCKQLALNRKLTDEQRFSIYAKQDACLWIITLGDSNPKETIDSIKKLINQALQSV